MLIDKYSAVIAPEFDGVDSQGRSVRLSDFRNKKNVMLVFNRGFS